MRWHLPGVLALVLSLAGARPIWSGVTHAALGLEYDDNPFHVLDGRRPGWVSRLYLSTDNRLLDQPGLALDVRHHCGVKRFWRPETAAAQRGDVVANHLEVRGAWQPRARLQLDWTADAKLKSVQRIDGEQSYLRGGLRLGVTHTGGHGVQLRLEVRRQHDDARDSVLVDLAQDEIGAELSWQRRRTLVGRCGVRVGRLEYGRASLVRDPEEGVVAGAARQADGLVEASVGAQLYAGMLLETRYAFVANGSNSVGYDYRAHCLQLSAARHVGGGVDAQVFAAVQLRDYTEPLGDAVLVPERGAQEEYEQQLLALRLARQLTAHYGLSCQYRWARNGGRGDRAAYRQRVYALALDMTLL